MNAADHRRQVKTNPTPRPLFKCEEPMAVTAAVVRMSAQGHATTQGAEINPDITAVQSVIIDLSKPRRREQPIPPARTFAMRQR